MAFPAKNAPVYSCCTSMCSKSHGSRLAISSKSALPLLSIWRASDVIKPHADWPRNNARHSVPCMLAHTSELFRTCWVTRKQECFSSCCACEHLIPNIFWIRIWSLSEVRWLFFISLSILPFSYSLFASPGNGSAPHGKCVLLCHRDFALRGRTLFKHTSTVAYSAGS